MSIRRGLHQNASIFHPNSSFLSAKFDTISAFVTVRVDNPSGNLIDISFEKYVEMTRTHYICHYIVPLIPLLAFVPLLKRKKGTYSIVEETRYMENKSHIHLFPYDRENEIFQY